MRPVQDRQVDLALTLNNVSCETDKSVLTSVMCPFRDRHIGLALTYRPALSYARQTTRSSLVLRPSVIGPYQGGKQDDLE